MTIFYIPACGDRLILEKDWEFDLYLEHRNTKFAKTIGVLPENPRDTWTKNGYRKVRAKVEAGMTLEVDRVYIRTDNHLIADKDYDSITFRVLKGEKAVKNSRFWVKLPDTYSIEYHQDPDSRYRDRVKAIKEVMER